MENVWRKKLWAKSMFKVFLLFFFSKSNFQVDTTCPFVLFLLLRLYIFHGTVEKSRAVSICCALCLLCRSRRTASNLKKMEMFSYDHPSAFLHSDARGLYCVYALLSNRMNRRWLNNVGTINFTL